MTEAIEPAPHAPLSAATLEAVVVAGDLSRLTPAQRLEYYRARCASAGLDPAAQPFQYISLQGKLVLYATKGGTDQLSRVHGIKVSIVNQATESGLRVVQVRAESKDGRATEEIGAVNIEGLKGEALANAMMKAVTKAKRRAILSMCGLGMMDETETDTVPGARTVEVDLQTGEVLSTVSNSAPKPSEADRMQREIEAWGEPAAEPKRRIIDGIPINCTKDWKAVATALLGGHSPYAKLSFRTILDQEGADEHEALDYFESTVIPAIHDLWNRMTPAKKAKGLDLNYECALIAYGELMNRRAPSPFEGEAS